MNPNQYHRKNNVQGTVYVVSRGRALQKPLVYPQIGSLKTPLPTLFALLATILLPVGCARYQAKPLSLATAATAFDRRSLTNSDVQAFVSARLTNQLTPITNWNLDALTLAAAFYHPSLQLARAQADTAAAGKLTAAARPNPTVSFSPGYNFSAVSPANPWIPGATLEIPIETAGKRGKRILEAQQLALAAQFTVTSTAWQIRSNIHLALIELSAARERDRLVSEQISHQSALLRLLEQRLTAGAIAANELLPIQIAQARFQSDLAAARASSVQSRAHLADAIGIPIANLPALELHDESLAPFEDIAALRASALQHRADLLAALARYEAAQAALQLEIAKQYPDIRIGSGYQWDQGEHKWNMLLSLELPVLNRNQGPIAQAEARRTERAIEVIDAQARAINEIDRAIASIQSATSEAARARDTLQTVQKQSQAVRERLAAGAADQSEVASAAIEETAAALVALDSNTRALAAQAQLEAALQIPSGIIEAANAPGLASQ
ncbi:MAG TPA: TolC family protein [Verrucomicrobiae bacterium]|nr:TolC family protein [Verrucomicrobiae bacterium]